MAGQEELLPCPFCGGEKLELYYGDIEGWIAHVRCIECDDMIGPMSEFKYETKEEAAGDAIAAWNTRSLRNAQSEAVAVKALEWHKSHVPSWNGDWHTTSPFIYTVRCADENGWKWSAHSGCGYAPTPESAKAAAQADYEQRIRSALTHPAPPLAVTDQPATHRHKKRGTEYVLIGIGKMQAENWLDGVKFNEVGFRPSIDMRDVAIYRAANDGSLWVRPREDFEDGRFEALTAALEAKQ